MSSRAFCVVVSLCSTALLSSSVGCGRLSYRERDGGVTRDAETHDASMDAERADSAPTAPDAPMRDAGCVSGAACATSNACEVGMLDCSSGVGVCVAAGPRASGTLCRGAAGTCDVPEFCDGVGIACPTDLRVSAGTECRAITGSCDVAEACDGLSAACPADQVRAAATICRPTTGPCDAAEVCDGVSGACAPDTNLPAGSTCRPARSECDVVEQCDALGRCPDDVVAPAGVACAGGTQTCDGTGSCVACTSGAPCDTGNACELGELDCAVVPPRCVPAGVRAGSVCRAASGPCDVEERCDGTLVSCPVDAFASTLVTCRPAIGPCDATESCSGASPSCPADARLSGVTCRVSAGPCDALEVCDGTSVSCPPDVFAPATLQCRAQLASCDVPERCTGAGPLCPGDGFQASGTVCSAATECTTGSTCPGTGAVCPTPGLFPSGTACSVGECDAAGRCTLREACGGWSIATTPDVLLAATLSEPVSANAMSVALHRAIDGAPQWMRLVGADALAASMGFVFTENDAVFHTFNLTGSLAHQFEHRPSTPWTRRLAVNAMGGVLIASTTAEMSWSFTPQPGFPVSGSDGPATFLTVHDPLGNMLRTLRIGHDPHLLHLAGLDDGRWVIAVANRHATPVAFVGHMVAPGASELVVLTPALEVERFDTLPFTPHDVATFGNTRVVVGQPGVAAFDDGGMQWLRMDCGAERVAVAPGDVYVAEYASGPYCGVATSVASDALRSARLDIATGETRSGTTTRFVGLAGPPLGIEVTGTGGVYVALPPGASVCGAPPLGPPSLHLVR